MMSIMNSSSSESNSGSWTPAALGPKKTIFLTALIVAVIAFQLNATMLNPAVQNMKEVLQATDAEIGRSSALFFLATALFGIFVPRLSDMIGRRLCLQGCLAALMAGTIIAMLAPNMLVLYLGRVIQGACGPVVPLALLILRNECPDSNKYGALMGLIVAINGGIAGVDVILGGWIADTFGFRYILLLTLILELIAIVAISKWVPESRPTPDAKMDWMGVIYLCITVVSLTWLISGDILSTAWPDWRTPIWAVLTVVAFALFLRQEKKAPEPLIPPQFMKSRAVWSLPLNTFMTLTAIFAAVNLALPSFTQNPTAGWGMSATMTALAFMSPYALIGWAIGPAAGYFAPRIGYLKTLRVGTAGALLSLLFMVMFGFTSKPLMFAAALLLGITYAGISNVILNGLGIILAPKEAPGLLVGLNGASFGIGAGLSCAILGQIITLGSPIGSTVSNGYIYAVWAAVILTLITLLCSFLLPKTSPQGDKL